MIHIHIAPLSPLNMAPMILSHMAPLRQLNLAPLSLSHMAPVSQLNMAPMIMSQIVSLNQHHMTPLSQPKMAPSHVGRLGLSRVVPFEYLTNGTIGSLPSVSIESALHVPL